MIYRYILFGCFIFLTAFSLVKNNEPKALEVVLRQIGDRILKSSNDTTSRVLPIIKKESNIYVISFENQLVITSDSLYKIVENELKRVGIEDYVVELKECRTQQVFLSFLYSKQLDSITPCQGRHLPLACYALEITMLTPNVAKRYLWLFMTFLIIPLLYMLYKFGFKKAYSDNKNMTMSNIGENYLDLRGRKLWHGNESINLTKKESKLFTLLLEGKDEIKSREFLMNEIWEDSGVVVVPKNLDVLVSKLRKKLLIDDRLIISNVHGIGYKFEIVENKKQQD